MLSWEIGIYAEYILRKRYPEKEVILLKRYTDIKVYIAISHEPVDEFLIPQLKSFKIIQKSF